MKKLLMFITAIVMLAGCQKDDSTSLVGTKWTYEFNNSPYVLEFTSENDVRNYEVDNNYNFKASLTEGNYNYDSGKITFSGNIGVIDAALIILYYRYYFKSATIRGDVMELTASDETIVFPIKDGEVQEPEITYNGEHTFTLMKL